MTDETKQKRKDTLARKYFLRHAFDLYDSLTLECLPKKHRINDIEKWKKALSLAASRRVGEKNHFYGRTHTIESRKKMSMSKKSQTDKTWDGFKKDGEYPVEFQRIRKDIIERDCGFCQVCFIDKNIVGKKEISMSVHHIDYNKKHCSPENLLCVCNRCNTMLNRNREEWTSILLKEEFGKMAGHGNKETSNEENTFEKESNKNFTIKGHETLINRVKSLIYLFNEGIFPFKGVMFGFPLLKIESIEECYCRILELVDLTGFQCNFVEEQTKEGTIRRFEY